MQPLRAATECEVDLVRKRLDHAGSDLGYRNSDWSFTYARLNLTRLTWTSPCEDWSLTTLKEKLIKIGAKVISLGRYVAFQMAEVAIPRILFADILRLVSELRPPPAVAST